VGLLVLRPPWESAVRKAAPNENNILVAKTVLPEGPADNKVKSGDVLIMVNGELLTSFVKLDEILDSSVGGTVLLLIQRGGKDIEVAINVGDLLAITPDRFVTVWRQFPRSVLSSVHEHVR
jgi:pro-apoptotic serine protease NMA111